jgi:hypothetical protein
MIFFFNYRLQTLSQKLKSAILLLSIVFTGSAYALPGKIEASSDTIPDSTHTFQSYRYLTLNSFGFKSLKAQKNKASSFNPDPSWIWDTIPSKTAITSDKLVVSGVIRFITYYRDMSKAYSDMITSKKNISFLDYPLANAGTTSTGGYPLIELSLTSKVSANFNFHVGYSLAHNFTGQADGDLARNISSRQKLFFSGNYNTRDVKVGLTAGTILWTAISKFTVSQPEYRDDYFDRLPWDWYRKSFERYENYYSLSANVGSQQSVGTAPVQGFVSNVDLLPYDIKIKTLFGRTNRTLAPADATTYFPAYTFSNRAEKTIFTGPLLGIFGVNYYLKAADTDRSHGIPDNTQILSADAKLKIRKIGIFSELGVGKINNPSAQNKTGVAFNLKVDLDKNVSPLPVSAEIYSIDKNVVSLDGGVLNSGNSHVLDGGYATQYIYSQLLAVNVMQETQQLANNRRGIILKAEKKIGRLKVQINTAMSQEIENLFDTITIQHRVNAFSRSRFRPWYQAGGPYARLKSQWRRTYETITINDEALGNSTNYKKGFNGVDLLLKYKLNFLKRELVLINITNYNSVQDAFSPIPIFSSKAFIRTFYNEFTAAYKLGGKFTIVGTAGIERVLGNTRVNLSPDKITDASGNPYAAKDRVIDQTGTRLGTGIDYDFSATAGLHLRRTWMSQKDKNFIQDQFKGNETTIELKIFF